MPHRRIEAHRGVAASRPMPRDVRRAHVGPAALAYGDHMSGIRAATVLAIWGAAYRSGAASPDETIARLAEAGRTAGVRAADAPTAARTGLPGPGEAGAGSLALLDLLRRGGRPNLVLPVAGDVRGLPPGGSVVVPALDAGGAVLLPLSRLAIVPGDGHWRVYSTDVNGSRSGSGFTPPERTAQPAPHSRPEMPTGPISLFDADYELDRAIRAAAAQLTALEVARSSASARSRIAALMLAEEVPVPCGTARLHRHASEMLAKVVSIEALLRVATDHNSAAVTRYELAAVDHALTPLAIAVRNGRLAAVAAMVIGLDSADAPIDPVQRRMSDDLVE